MHFFAIKMVRIPTIPKSKPKQYAFNKIRIYVYLHYSYTRINLPLQVGLLAFVLFFANFQLEVYHCLNLYPYKIDCILYRLYFPGSEIFQDITNFIIAAFFIEMQLIFPTLCKNILFMIAL